MSIPSDGQMTWKIEGATLAVSAKQRDAALHLRHDFTKPWSPYEEFPQYFLPDPPKFSKRMSEKYQRFLHLPPNPPFWGTLKEDWFGSPPEWGI